MNDDEILKRVLTGFGVLGGGYLFLYLVIISTQHPPLGYALGFVRTFETVARWLFCIAIVLAILFFVLAIIGHFQNKWRQESERQSLIKQKEERERLRAIEVEEEAKQNQIKLDQENLARKLRQIELNQLRIEKETYLKNRSAEDAAKDALQNFM